jgi:CBS domain containing-hemolysin-like protein
MIGALLFIALLIAINALYVAAEFSAVAVSKSELAPLARDGSRRAAGVLALLEDGALLDRFIATCQVGITLSSLGAGAFGQATIAIRLADWLQTSQGVGEAAAQSSAVLAVLLSLTTLQVVIGELVPKSLALQMPERVALLTYLPTRWSTALFRPIIWLLNGSGLLLLKPFGVTPGGHDHVHSPEEIRLLLAESRRGGELSPEAHRRLERGLRLSTRTARQMMTPRNEIYALDANLGDEALLELILASPYTRLPVYRGSLDNIIGAVNVKDVVASFTERGRLPRLTKLVRPIAYVPETLRAHRLVRTLQQQTTSKAIVVDEYGGVEGIISFEDILTELFGDIGDELKEPDPDIEILDDGTLRIPGSAPLEEVREVADAPWRGTSSTVGGYIVGKLGRLPREGEEIELEGIAFRVVEMLPTSVKWIEIPTESATAASPAKAEG